MSLLPFRLCLRDSHFNCSKTLVILPVSKLYFPVTNLAARCCTFSNSSWRVFPLGSQTGLAYSRTGLSSPLICHFLNISGAWWDVTPQEAKSSICLCTDITYMSVPLQVVCYCYCYTKILDSIYIFQDCSL